jgi:ribonuclease BN (tRNA processing enzyme)
VWAADAGAVLLTVLGCRQGMPADGQPSSAYLVRADGRMLLLDCGPGAATALSALAHPAELDAVVISHLHSDHCYDLLPLGKTLLAGRLRDPRRYPTLPDAKVREWPPVPLLVPPGGRAALDALARALPVPGEPVLDRSFDLAFEVREYSPGQDVQLNGWRIGLRPLRHSLDNCGIRVERAGSTLFYSGDTDDPAGLGAAAHGADLLLCESTLEIPDGRHGHMSAAQAGEAARIGEVGELVLTHFVTADPGWLAARRADALRAFPGRVHLAAPGLDLALRAGA